VKTLGLKPLKQSFFNRPTLDVARDLIDKYLVTKYYGKICGGKIVETEAYLGTEDQASHASAGITHRSKLMYGKAGYIYVYIIYGMHYCFNVTTEQEGVPGAVLIRAIEPEIGIETMKNRRGKNNLLDLASGPAKLTQALKINIRHNGRKLSDKNICIMDDGKKSRKVFCGSRIGISKALNLDYRCYIKDNRFVSK
jgi:DNA-3-methyladenine glycosylase